MKTITLLALIAICTFSFADENYNNVMMLKKTTLCVVVDNEQMEAYKKLKSVIEKSWTFNKYKFIKSDEVDQYITNPSYSVMTFIALTLDPAPPDQIRSYYCIGSLWLTKDPIKRLDGWGLYIMQGNKKNKYDRSKGNMPAKRLDDISPVWGELFPGDYKELGSFDHMVAHALKKMQDDMQSVSDKQEMTRFGAYGEMEKDGKVLYFNGGKSGLPGKTLLVDKDILGKINTAEKFSRTFKIPAENIKFVSKTEIALAIENGDESIVYCMNTYNQATLIFSAKECKIIAGIQ